MVDARGARRRSRAPAPGARRSVDRHPVLVGRPRSSSGPGTPTRWCSRPGGSGSRSLRSRLIVAVRRRSHPVMLRPPEVSRVRWALLVLGAGAFFASAAGERVRRDRQDPPPGRDADRRAAAGPDRRGRGAVPRRARRPPARLLRRCSRSVGPSSSRRRRRAAGTWSLAGEIVAVVSLFLNAGWYLYGRVLRARYAVDPFAFMLGVLTAAALLMTPVAAVSSGTLRMSATHTGGRRRRWLSARAAHVLLVWAHRYVPASVSAPLAARGAAARRARRVDLLRRVTRSDRDRRLDRRRCRAVGDEPQPRGGPGRGRDTRSAPPAHLNEEQRIRTCRR